MGSSFTARCEECDLEADGLIGGGMENFMTFAAWPCLCASCKDITTVNSLEEPLICLKCESIKVTPYDTPSLSVDGPPDSWGPDISWGTMHLDTTRSYLCPHCAKFAVVFGFGGRSFD